jgi:hypothetical protein
MSEAEIVAAIKKKLTLAGCFKYTHDKAKPTQGNVATPSYKRVMKWACEYFGVGTKGLKIPDSPNTDASSNASLEPAPQAAKSGTVNMDFDALFD